MTRDFLSRRRLLASGFAFALGSAPMLFRPARAAAGNWFRITVTDAQTGRGIPLVELETVDSQRFYTDSNGIAAIGEPEWMGQNVWFSVSSDGYQYPADGFGYRGKALNVTPGGSATIQMTRINIAERLYRLTGAGIYRDSILVGAPVPLQHPLLDGLVLGQDTVMATPYRGKIYWFFGDTERPGYPLGQFRTSGATSLLPGAGGLDPARGVDLTYWTDSSGFSRPMVDLDNPKGPVWVGGTFTLNTPAGERLYTHFAEVDHAMKTTRSGLARFDDARAVFAPIHMDGPSDVLHPEGYPFFPTVGGKRYLYCQPVTQEAYATVRVPADEARITDPSAYEGFTCLAPGARFAGENTPLERDGAGKLVYGWKPNTPGLGVSQQNTLIKAGKMKPDEAYAPLRDMETGNAITSHGGSVYWNPYRRRWIMISGQSFGSPSQLGELWFAEADTPVGPWVYARKIITHAHYTFYNPTQHPFFDQDGGKTIYLEGTYTDAFSDVKDITPLYNYNQIMYRLDLSDPRLALPMPVYRIGTVGKPRHAMREAVAAEGLWAQVQDIAFYAVPPERAHAGLVPISAPRAGAGQPPLCYALPFNPADGEQPTSDVVSLYQYSDSKTGQDWYSTDDGPSTPTAMRSQEPLCRVWRNPSSVLMLDKEAAPPAPIMGSQRPPAPIMGEQDH